MVAIHNIAVALRAKDGHNFLLQTKGLDTKMVAEAMNFAADSLSENAQNHGRGDEDWSGDTAPAFAFDEVATQISGVRVVFRRIHLVWVLVVIPAAGSMLTALQVLEQMTRVCLAAVRGPEVTPDKLMKKFPEVYLALAAVLASGPGASVADDSISAAQSLVMGRKLADEIDANAVGDIALPPDALMRVAVSDAPSPSQAPPQQGFSGLEGTGLEALAGGTGSYAPSGGHASSGALPSPTASSSTLAGTGLETLMSPATVNLDSPWGAGSTSAWGAGSAAPLDPALFGGMSPNPYLAAQGAGQPWAQSPVLPPSTPPDAQTESLPSAAGVPGTTSPPRSASPLPWEKLPAAPPRDAKAIARGQGLLLVELWRANFIGIHLVRAGLQGEVVGQGKLGDRSRASALYRLAAPPDSAATVTASLRAAALDTGLGERGATPGSFVAHLGAVPKQQAVFLRYRLPAIACHPPILLGLTATLGLGPEHSQAGVTLMVQYAISPTLTGSLRSATLDLDVPAGLGPASQVFPHAEWSASQRRLRWRLEALDPSNTGVCCACFAEPSIPQAPASAPGTPGGSPKSPTRSPRAATAGKPAPPAWKAALAQTAAEARAAMCFVGPRDTTLSGIRLSSGAESQQVRPLVGARCAFHGEEVSN
ncbi:hypothetical protein WJX73_003471 [Symbiochloris irregularis]|uniref:MHD domain-containing protein n=1 Tax=Symbiochloris irregularis TaxID=706552 RepID=A0AAW1NPD6_9CHLO